MHKYHQRQSEYNIHQELTNIIGCICGKFTFLFFFLPLTKNSGYNRGNQYLHCKISLMAAIGISDIFGISLMARWPPPKLFIYPDS